MAELSECRVLVVEDEFYLAKDIQQMLKMLGCEILGPYPGSAEAKAALADGAPDVALVDVNLGHGPDFSLADALQAKGVPLIFVTGYDPEVIPARFADALRLEKPVDTTRLARTVAAACGPAERRNTG